MKQDQNFYLINVLSTEAYQDCHIKGSINVPFDSLEEWAEDVDPNTEIVVYCASFDCPLGGNAYKLLEGLGFKNLREYSGGISDWHHLGYPTEGNCKLDYLEPIHKPHQVDIKTIDAAELRKLLKAYGYLQN